MLYVARFGDNYRCSGPGLPEAAPAPASEPGMGDAWLYYSGKWPATADAFPAFFEELLAEMESMVGGPERCRWPLDDPYFHRH